jgi:uncharacterized membrane protein
LQKHGKSNIFGGNMIIIAVIATLVIGVLSAVIGYENGLEGLGLGTIFAIATMGGFILYALRKNSKNSQAN